MTSFALQTSQAFLRDEFVPFSEANVSIASSPVLYGLSIYSVFSVNWNAEQQKLYVFRLKDHYNRLVNSAQIMDFDSFAKEWPFERFERMMHELVKRNNIQEDVLVRVTVFIDEISAGTRIHGLKNSLSAYVYPLGEILPRTGINVCISSWVRNMDNSIPAKAKINGSYVNASLMKNEALQNGFDDAIALDHHGHVAESTVANLFIVRNGKLATPDTSTDILEGITRDSLIEVAKKMGLVVEERSIDRTELYKSSEAFLCGTSALIVPILSIDKRPVNGGQPGEITQKLLTEYQHVLEGNDPAYAGWLTAL
jgi:branched-chain amino acid aminotransferase